MTVSALGRIGLVQPLSFAPKAAASDITVTIDVSAWLGSDTLAQVGVAAYLNPPLATGPMTLADLQSYNPTFSGGTISCTLAGGIEGVTYTVVFSAHTAGGQVGEWSVQQFISHSIG